MEAKTAEKIVGKGTKGGKKRTKGEKKGLEEEKKNKNRKKEQKEEKKNNEGITSAPHRRTFSILSPRPPGPSFQPER